MKKKLIFSIICTLSFIGLQAQDLYVSEVHKENVGKILFSKNVNLDLTVATANDFQTTFTSKDEVAACVFFIPNQDGRYRYKGRIIIDGVEPGLAIDNEKSKPAFVTYILANQYSTENGEFSNYVLDMTGEHKVRIELWDKYDGNKKVLASGEFTISKVSEEIVPTIKFSTIKAGMSNPTLEQQAVTVMNTKAKNENWDEKFTKAKIVSTAWEIRKNPVTGVIEDRVIYMKLLGVWPDGKCKVVDFGFRQDYVAGKYSSLKFNSIGEMKPVICE